MLDVQPLCCWPAVTVATGVSSPKVISMLAVNFSFGSVQFSLSVLTIFSSLDSNIEKNYGAHPMIW